jgi:hypothetical protein
MEMTLPSPDRKWRNHKWRDRKWRDRKYVLCMPGSAFPRICLTIVVVQNVLRMTGSSMTNGWDFIKCHVIPKGVPLEGWDARMRNRKLRNIRWNVTRRASPGRVECAHPWSEVPLGCSLGHTGPINLSLSNPFTGYLPLSRHFIFMESTFNNYISYKCLLFSDILCNTPSFIN